MPDGWTNAALGDVCQVVVDRRDAPALGGAPYVGLEHMHSQSPRVATHGTTADVTSQVVAFKASDTLFGRLRPYLRKVALADFDGYCSPEILVLRSNTANVLPGFLYLLVSSDSTIRWAVSASTGSRMPRTSASDLLALEVGILPTCEQRRIVDLVGAVDEVVSNLSRAQAQAADAYMKLLSRVFGDELQKTDAVPLAHLADTRLGKMLDSKRLTGDAFPYLANVNVRWDAVDLEGLKVVPLTDQERQDLDLRAGDALVCEGGEAGRTAVLAEDLPGIYFQKAVHRVRFGPRLRPRFFLHFMKYATTNGLLTDYVSALTIQHLTGEKLRLIPIPLPAVAQQDSVVALLDAFLEFAQSASTAAERGTRARSSILDGLLSGEHEIPSSYDRFLDDVA